MILINDVKFACMECIRGHRLLLCRHHQRPLLQVRGKGRPHIPANGNKNHRIAVFAEEIATDTPLDCKDYPVIILKALDKKVIDLKLGEIVGPYRENAQRKPVIHSDSFVNTSGCCSRAAKVSKCGCNKKKVSKSRILNSYMKRHAPREEPLFPMDETLVSNNGAVFEVINVPLCTLPGTCSCSADCACPGCAEHNKPDLKPDLNNAQFGSNLVLLKPSVPAESYPHFLQQLMTIRDKDPDGENDPCVCPDDACYCTNCETHGIIEGYKLDDIFNRVDLERFDEKCCKD